MICRKQRDLPAMKSQDENEPGSIPRQTGRKVLLGGKCNHLIKEQARNRRQAFAFARDHADMTMAFRGGQRHKHQLFRSRHIRNTRSQLRQNRDPEPPHTIKLGLITSLQPKRELRGNISNQ